VLAGLLAGSVGGCSAWRPDCPACTDPNFLANSCPYRESKLVASANSDVLFLSGGGAHGAWGAGVLVGWPAPRPNFRVVTGISTGALQAPLVFLNQDAKLQQLFTQTTNAQVYRWKWYALTSNSVQSREPLKQLIDANLTDADIRQVAAITDRELFVGTVNLDSSDFCPWNLSAVAQAAKGAESAGDSEKAECYFDLFRDVIWAASGAPILAPPVEIDPDHCDTLGSADAPPWRGAMHVDGGARLRVFAEGILTTVLGGGSSTAYVIMNGKTVLHEQCTVDSIGPIAVRSAEIMMAENVIGSLHYLKGRLGANWNLKLSRIANDYAHQFGTGEFVPAKMQVLFDKGKNWAATGAWETDIPTERVTKAPPGTDRIMMGCRP
jgi:hypothetical protein